MHHKNNNLKVIIAFANFLGSEMTFYEIKKKEQVLAFLNTKIRDPIKDPERRWITTWNHYLNRIRLFSRWFYNCRDKEFDRKNINQSEYETPEFVRIKPKKTSRPSPNSETEIWERDEILFVIKYEQYIRNKAVLTLFWDLDARNHEVTLLKIKHIRLKERICVEEKSKIVYELEARFKRFEK
jgi:integrase/recombinase XerD